MQKNKPTISYVPELNKSFDFIFESVDLAVLIENGDRQVEFANALFCSLFQIRLSTQEILHTNTLSNAKGFSQQFDDAEAFEKLLFDLPSAAQPIRNKNCKLKNESKVALDYFPIYYNNTLKGHIWIFKQQKSSLMPVTVNFNSSATIIENALNHLPGEIAIYNTNAQIEFINAAYITNAQKRSWAKGKTIVQYYSYANLPAQTALYRLENIKKTIATGQLHTWDELNISAEKNKQYILRSCYPVFDSNNNIESVIEQSIDITTQKSLEQQLNVCINNFHTVLNSIDEVVLQTDGDLRVQFLNNAWQNLMGDIEEHKGKQIFEMLSIKRYDLYAKMFAVLSGSEQAKSGTLTLIDKSGKEKLMQYNLHPTFNVDENKQGILATLTDITNKKLQEEQLLELVKKEKELNELKTAFVNMVSHELRTPLTVISSSAEILELLLQAGKGYNETKTYTEQIISEVEKMTAFMQDLLMVSKIESGKIEPNLSNTDIAGFIQKTINTSFNPWKDGRKTIVEVKRNSNHALVDIQMLEHAFQNLLQNAFKYSSGKAEPKVRIGFSKTYFTISVVDNGIGIPENEISKLFTSFYRASNTSNISGTGFGLVVAKYFTEHHKGQIFVKSKINKGSIFTLKLPYSYAK